MNLEFIKPQNLGSLLMKSSQSNFDLQSPSSFLVCSQLNIPVIVIDLTKCSLYCLSLKYSKSPHIHIFRRPWWLGLVRPFYKLRCCPFKSHFDNIIKIARKSLAPKTFLCFLIGRLKSKRFSIYQLYEWIKSYYPRSCSTLRRLQEYSHRSGVRSS